MSCSCMEGQCHYGQALEPKQQTNPQRKVGASLALVLEQSNIDY